MDYALVLAAYWLAQLHTIRRRYSSAIRLALACDAVGIALVCVAATWRYRHVPRHAAWLT